MNTDISTEVEQINSALEIQNLKLVLMPNEYLILKTGLENIFNTKLDFSEYGFFEIMMAAIRALYLRHFNITVRRKFVLNLTQIEVIALKYFLDEFDEQHQFRRVYQVLLDYLVNTK